MNISYKNYDNLTCINQISASVPNQPWPLTITNAYADKNAFKIKFHALHFSSWEK
uniref:Uncharacterized protein n=1 Tax=Anguilla anguilla TaxID=7936 RepID=A0A0E9W1X5_ANGAN